MCVWGGGEAAESAPCCLPWVWRAERAMALDSQPPPLDGLTISTPFLLYSPPFKPPPQTSSPLRMGRSQGVGAKQGFGLSSGYSCLAQGPEKRRVWVP